MRRWVLGSAIAMALAAGGSARAADLLGVACTTPAPAHCADTGCTSAELANLGDAVEPKSGRKFFLDYPCNLKPGEKVTFILSLHGGGSIGNWQRHYFPLIDLKEKHRLVIATPSGTANVWNAEKDDAYLRGVVEQVEGAVGRENIKAFWLVGHSLGGQTSNRLIMTDPFFSQRLTGWVSLSGGRLGSRREDIRAAIPGRAPPGAPPGPMRLAADASILPERPFSFIYETGEHEMTAAGLPPGSPWAEKLRCKARTAPRRVVDTKAGYVQDSRPQAEPNKIWGLKARPGVAEIHVYPGCADGRVVADVVRLDKGHTEGLEPQVTEEIVKLMLTAK